MIIPSASILHHFATIPDPRVNRQKKHQLQDIFVIALCAVICGADNWVEIEDYGRAKEDWFTEQLGLENGIPSHDTFGAVFAAIDQVQFSECFSRWVADLCTLTAGEIIAIDGKCLRRSLDNASKKAAIHLVSAWAQQNGLVLGQVKVDDKSNEITAIPKLLERLDIAGAVVTIDAMGCQKKIAEQIVQKNADYLLSLKGNQGSLLEDVETFFQSKLAPEALPVSLDSEHGRLETRSIAATDHIEWLRERHPDWPKLTSIVAVTCRQEKHSLRRNEIRYFISSLPADDPHHLAQAVRAHWTIENNLHWVLDVAFNEDQSRARQGHSAANMAVMRHIALNLVKNDPRKVGIQVKRKRAGWDNDYLLNLLRGI